MQSPHEHSVLTAVEVRRVLRTAKDLNIDYDYRAVLKNLDPDGFSLFSILVADAAPNTHRVSMQLKMRDTKIPVTGYASIPVNVWAELRNSDGWQWNAYNAVIKAGNADDDTR